jgi:hypothetical protein
MKEDMSNALAEGKKPIYIYDFEKVFNLFPPPATSCEFTNPRENTQQKRLTTFKGNN